jgi:zinc transport system ATP-binding protein
MQIINIQNVTFSYEKQTILEDINLEVNKDDFLAIIGPNGGGKSTLLKLILGIIEPKSGSISVFSKSPSKHISQIGYVPQNTNINIEFPIRVIDVVLMGISKNIFSFGYTNEQKENAIEALQRVGMEEYSNRKIGNLSGGQRQRVMIARSLCSHPKLLILDEPTASIDVGGQKQIYDLLKELNKEITIVVVSHDISVILGYANKVAHVNKKLTYHDIEKHQQIKTKDDEHFCEVEMLNLLGKCSC